MRLGLGLGMDGILIAGLGLDLDTGVGVEIGADDEVVVRGCSIKKVYLKNFLIFTRKHLCWSVL